jgi:Holliday junction resolvasome RuvABC endonuclease subunit
LESGTFTAKGKDLGERLYDIRQKVSNLISKYNINYLIFEDI